MQRRPLVIRNLLRAAVLASGLTWTFVTLAARAAETTQRFDHATEAPVLVQAALDAEMAGDPAKQSALLAEAIVADPEFAPAHWRLGEVKFDGRWRSVDDVARLTTTDARWAGYRELRDSLGASPADHLRLAEYTRDNGLENEGRYHWAIVLLADPGNAAARDYLGMEVYRSRLFTHEQVAMLKQLANDAESNLRRHRAELTRLCRDATRATTDLRNAALDRIAALSDPTMIAPLEMLAEKACAKSPRSAGALHLAVVAALGNMPQHDATLRLLNHAVYADSAEVRTRAAQALRGRVQTDYVPLLMAALRSPVEVDFDVLATPDGSVRLTEIVRQEGPVGDTQHVRSTNLLTEGALEYDPNRSNPAQVLSGNMTLASSRLADTQAAVEATNAAVAALNERIEEVLRLATGQEIEGGAGTWWAHWEAHNEIQSLANRQIDGSYEDSTYIYSYPQAPKFVSAREQTGKLALAPEPRVNPRPLRERNLRLGSRSRYGLVSCFAPGTPVWTQGGAVGIEKVQVGDFVIAQNPHTGEVAYRPVLEVTLGEPTRIVDLKFRHGELISATRGHRFWAIGHGWRMAKELGPAARLSALGGRVEVESVDPGELVACYNLRVDEFHTYFVGQSRILVHDLTCPEPEIAAIPGSEATRMQGLKATTINIAR